MSFPIAILYLQFTQPVMSLDLGREMFHIKHSMGRLFGPSIMHWYYWPLFSRDGCDRSDVTYIKENPLWCASWQRINETELTKVTMSFWNRLPQDHGSNRLSVLSHWRRNEYSWDDRYKVNQNCGILPEPSAGACRYSPFNLGIHYTLQHTRSIPYP